MKKIEFLFDLLIVSFLYFAVCFSEVLGLEDSLKEDLSFEFFFAKIVLLFLFVALFSKKILSYKKKSDRIFLTLFSFLCLFSFLIMNSIVFASTVIRNYDRENSRRVKQIVFVVDEDAKADKILLKKKLNKNLVIEVVLRPKRALLTFTPLSKIESLKLLKESKSESNLTHLSIIALSLKERVSLFL